MASVVYNRGKQRLLAGSVDLTKVRIMILTSNTTTPDDPDHEFVDDIVADEADGTGYARSGYVANITVSVDNTEDEAILTHNDVVFSEYGPDSPALFLVYFEEGQDDSSSSLLWINDLSTLDSIYRTPDGNDFIVRAPTGGVIKATNGS